MASIQEFQDLQRTLRPVSEPHHAPQHSTATMAICYDNAVDSCTAPINNMNIIYNHHNQLSDSPKTVTSTSEMMAHLAK